MFIKKVDRISQSTSLIVNELSLTATKAGYNTTYVFSITDNTLE